MSKQRTRITTRGGSCLLLLVVVLLLTSCAKSDSYNVPPGVKQSAVVPENFSASDPFSRKLRDANGREVIVKEIPRRIASQTLGTDEILLAICDAARLTRLSPLALDESYSFVVDEARRENLRPAYNAEEILAANPDLIFVASFSRADTIETLQSAGATIFRLGAFDSIEDIETNIRKVGYLVGEDRRAAELIESMNAELAAVKARVDTANNGGRKPRIMSYGVSGNSAGAGTLFDSIARAAGAINVTAEEGFDGFPKISAEQVARWNPDYLVVGANPREFDAVRARLIGNPAIAASDAGRVGRIILIDDRALLSVSHHITKAVDALARGLYEEKR